MSSAIRISMSSKARARLDRARYAYTVWVCIACVWGVHTVASALWRAARAIQVVL